MGAQGTSPARNTTNMKPRRSGLTIAVVVALETARRAAPNG